MKTDIDQARATIKYVRELRESVNTVDDEYDKIILLSQESHILKDTLKNMNAGLSRYIEIMKDYRMKKMGRRKYGNENLSVHYKLKSKEAEKVNYEKMIMALTQEYEKLKERLEIVGDPSYTLKLREEIRKKTKVKLYFKRFL